MNSVLVSIVLIALLAGCGSPIRQLPSMPAPQVPAVSQTNAQAVDTLPVTTATPTPASMAALPAPTPTVESAREPGEQANGPSHTPSISADGRYVAFCSAASNLVPGDTNARDDVFVHDRQSGRTERVSVASDGTQGNGRSFSPSISADGRWVAFVSEADNLVAGESAQPPGIFVHDRITHRTERAAGPAGDLRCDDCRAVAISGDGHYLTFASAGHVFVYDRNARTVEQVSIAADGKPANRSSSLGTISQEGRWVAFASMATNLVPGDDDYWDDIFVYDRQTQRLELVTLGADGRSGNAVSAGPKISADGRWVAFVSDATNLVAEVPSNCANVFLHDRQTGQTRFVARLAQEGHGYVALTGAAYTSLSADGRWLAIAYNGVLLYDRDTSQLKHVADDGLTPSISGDGRYLAFSSGASSLVPSDTNGVEDIFVYDRQTGRVERVSLASH